MGLRKKMRRDLSECIDQLVFSIREEHGRVVEAVMPKHAIQRLFLIIRYYWDCMNSYEKDCARDVLMFGSPRDIRSRLSSAKRTNEILVRKMKSEDLTEDIIDFLNKILRNSRSSISIEEAMAHLFSMTVKPHEESRTMTYYIKYAESREMKTFLEKVSILQDGIE